MKFNCIKYRKCFPLQNESEKTEFLRNNKDKMVRYAHRYTFLAKIGLARVYDKYEIQITKERKITKKGKNFLHNASVRYAQSQDSLIPRTRKEKLTYFKECLKKVENDNASLEEVNMTLLGCNEYYRSIAVQIIEIVVFILLVTIMTVSHSMY